MLIGKIATSYRFDWATAKLAVLVPPPCSGLDLALTPALDLENIFTLINGSLIPREKIDDYP